MQPRLLFSPLDGDGTGAEPVFPQLPERGGSGVLLEKQEKERGPSGPGRVISFHRKGLHGLVSGAGSASGSAPCMYIGPRPVRSQSGLTPSFRAKRRRIRKRRRRRKPNRPETRLQRKRRKKKKPRPNRCPRIRAMCCGRWRGTPLPVRCTDKAPVRGVTPPPGSFQPS